MNWRVFSFICLVGLVGCNTFSDLGEPDEDACDDFCNLAIETCDDVDPPFPSSTNGDVTDFGSCIEACLELPNDSEAEGATGGNTVQCRITHLKLGETDPVRHCPHAEFVSTECN